jgi:hypothetical protein
MALNYEALFEMVAGDSDDGSPNFIMGIKIWFDRLFCLIDDRGRGELLPGASRVFLCEVCAVTVAVNKRRRSLIRIGRDLV